MTWTYEKREGKKYQETRKLSLVEIAKLIRQDIKDLKVAGKIPVGVKTWVRTEPGLAIDVEWDFDGKIYEYDRTGYYGAGIKLNQFGKKIQEAIEEVRRQYNYDASEVQVDYFDVRYYGGTSCRTREWAVRGSQFSNVAAGEADTAITLIRDGMKIEDAFAAAARLEKVGA